MTVPVHKFRQIPMIVSRHWAVSPFVSPSTSRDMMVCFPSFFSLGYKLMKNCVARERMIGWYHTGPELRSSDQDINDLFKRFIARPVMVIVDVRAQVVGNTRYAYRCLFCCGGDQC
jgi:proteasome lid subunit RPN8/RPN11